MQRVVAGVREPWAFAEESTLHSHIINDGHISHVTLDRSNVIINEVGGKRRLGTSRALAHDGING